MLHLFFVWTSQVDGVTSCMQGLCTFLFFHLVTSPLLRMWLIAPSTDDFHDVHLVAVTLNVFEQSTNGPAGPVKLQLPPALPSVLDDMKAEDENVIVGCAVNMSRRCFFFEPSTSTPHFGSSRSCYRSRPGRLANEDSRCVDRINPLMSAGSPLVFPEEESSCGRWRGASATQRRGM